MAMLFGADSKKQAGGQLLLSVVPEGNRAVDVFEKSCARLLARANVVKYGRVEL